MLVLLIGRIYNVHLWNAFMLHDVSYIILGSFAKISTSVQAKLKFSLSNLNGCDVISEGKEYCSTPLRFAQVVWYTYQISRSLSQMMKKY
jgi:hypothetical protein